MARLVRPYVFHMSTRQSSIVVAVFPTESDAREAVTTLGRDRLPPENVSIVAPGTSPDDSPSSVFSTALAVSGRRDLSAALTSVGVPAGEARFYAREAESGRTLVVIDSSGQAEAIRGVLLNHGGYDVRSRGSELARNTGAGVRGGVVSRPVDATWRWNDVRSRYEMLWQQHYGTTDATWEEMEPIYRFAWQAANDRSNYGRPWSEAEASVRREWEAARTERRWPDVAGPIRDVWEDVAEEATQGTEGGADRRIPGPGTDQTVAARDLQSAS